ncbi:SDR family NAD(P)-dependent oxidoreductase [Aphanothece sacrum]|uniref:3-ketoacyl-ACP reductase n=1 Tax=Aphanothece sacrum FPU1 TaxID=1920663 RepID=A0A401IMB3_APHSA|nr:3-oxoacyl-ACP reductase family protein [Aphanothece sacrum]GBF82389.1 3-ketoacyl-ACP reductase [Aphanothece sacrum FPU1]GBF84290.1 3-ketoacyl-ACP reductase [Aphanothece sacrum FPU3]
MDINLQNKLALVTGSSRNIGKAIVKELAYHGATVVINARTSQEEAEKTVKEIEILGGKAIYVLADVGDEIQVKNMVRTVLEQLGAIDILINNTGLRRSCSITEMTTEQWRNVLAVNLDGPFFCCREVVPSMLAKGGGTIINVSGLNAFIGRANWSHVCASKMGAIGLTKALAVELALNNITVNHIVPGLIDTTQGYSNDKLIKKDPSASPQKRLGLPEEIASMCLYLASDAARFITGQTLHINGGALRY